MRRLVGRDLSAVIRGDADFADEPVYFMTSDDISRGLEQVTAARPYEPVVPPNQIETVVADLDNVTWKYSRYYDASDPDLPNQYEMYDLSADPYEERNLTDSRYATADSEKIRAQLAEILEEQRFRKAQIPVATMVTTRVVTVRDGGWNGKPSSPNDAAPAIVILSVAKELKLRDSHLSSFAVGACPERAQRVEWAAQDDGVMIPASMLADQQYIPYSCLVDRDCAPHDRLFTIVWPASATHP